MTIRQIDMFYGFFQGEKNFDCKILLGILLGKLLINFSFGLELDVGRPCIRRDC